MQRCNACLKTATAPCIIPDDMEAVYPLLRGRCTGFRDAAALLQLVHAPQGADRPPVLPRAEPQAESEGQTLCSAGCRGRRPTRGVCRPQEHLSVDHGLHGWKPAGEVLVPGVAEEGDIAHAGRALSPQALGASWSNTPSAGRGAPLQIFCFFRNPGQELAPRPWCTGGTTKGTSRMDSEQIKAVKRMQGFIEAHLAEPITLTGLARAARYSPWHAARLFKEYVGRPPFEYVRQRRLSSAAGKLCAAPRKVIDVAFDFVFDSHEGFTRAFTRQFGLSPRQFRRNKPSVVLFMPDRMRSYYPPHPKNDPMKAKTEARSQVVFVQIVDRPAPNDPPAREKARTTSSTAKKSAATSRAARPDQTGHPRTHGPVAAKLQRPGTSVYAHGVEVPADYAGTVPEGFELIDLPPCKMMVFQARPSTKRTSSRPFSRFGTS